MMAERPVFSISVPTHHKKGLATKAMVITSLAPTFPIVMPDVAVRFEESIEESTKSAPNSPERGLGEAGRKTKGGVRNKLSSKPKSPRSSQSDPESSPSPQRRPKWLPFLGRKKKKSPDLNGELDSDPDPVLSSGSSYEPEATHVEQLPGGGMSSNCVPEIRVSSEGEGVISFDDINSNLDPCRKNSQSSRCSSGSGLMSVGTSGFGSCPSRDESCFDLESPLSPSSPSSRTSSFAEDTNEDISSDSDPIEIDYPKRKSPSISGGSHGSHDNISLASVTTPTPTGDSPTLACAEAVSPTSPADEKRLHRALKKREKLNKQNVWNKVRTAVKAWSPFRVQFKKRSYPWVQLAGHEGNFKSGGGNGTILKKSDENERIALRQLLNDALRNFVPEFKGESVDEHDGAVYVEMTDLLREFNEPAVMDIKIGIRTYLEEELGKKNLLRNDMYKKMIDVDPSEPTEEEHGQEAITKPRYMQWRESLSSTSTLGFRIEGIKTTTGKALKDFKKTRTSEDVREALQTYLTENPSVKAPFLKRLLDIRATLTCSEFFAANELIGSSLLFVYDSSSLASINMIDFGKTKPLPEGVSITHESQWIEGNHEDGYLIGLDNLIRLWKDL